MLFQERYQDIMQRRKPTTTSRLWFFSILFGVTTFLLSLLYERIELGVIDYSTVNRSIAASAILSIGFSYALSGICYFWNFLDTKIIYRKQLGLVGMNIAIIHVLVSWYYYNHNASGSSYYSFYHIWNIGGVNISNAVSFTFGLVALAIFLMMALASRKFIMPKLGGKLWRELLRVGYVAMVLLIFHYGIKEYAVWDAWIHGSTTSWLPPLSFLVMLFTIAVVALRLTLHIALMYHKKLRTQAGTLPPQS
jgi:DMSO/TMAO reductase YedYZ heme-binding membrane subunit